MRAFLDRPVNGHCYFGCQAQCESLWCRDRSAAPGCTASSLAARGTGSAAAALPSRAWTPQTKSRRTYAESRERERLTAQPSLELVRTQVLVQRYLPSPPSRVLDVGGASGVYAAWLASRGYTVHLIDPVPLHIQQAAQHGEFTAAIGDARTLEEPAGSYDAVLLFGPLYHLVTPDDRLQALREAHRVTRPGGVVLAAAISRYASTFEGYFRHLIDRPGFLPMMRVDLHSGQHRNTTGDPDFFTTAYFHDPPSLASEVTAAGLQLDGVLPVEGPLAWAPDIERRLTDQDQRELILEVLATIERDPHMTSATAHLLAIAHH